MFGRVSRYDEHPLNRRAYQDVISRVTHPAELPIAAERSKTTPSKVVAPLVTLFLAVTTLSVYLSSENMFLGWVTHAIYFGILGMIVYHLCPPQLNERVEVNEQEVIFERLGITGYQVERIPLEQYRGVIPITCESIDPRGGSYKEYGAALRHPDPTKTVILALSPLLHDGLVEHYAQLLTLRPLFEDKFSLHLTFKGKWSAQSE